MKNDFAGGTAIPPETVDQEFERQKEPTGEYPVIPDLNNTFHKKDYRSDNPLEKSTRRCKNCGVLCASNSWEVHAHFCKIENGSKIITVNYPRVLKKLLEHKKPGGL